MKAAKSKNPRGNCVGSNVDGISATLLLLEVIAAPPFTGFHGGMESTLDDVSVDQTDVISNLKFYSLYKHLMMSCFSIAFTVQGW